MDIAKSETFKNFIILNKALLFLIKLSKTAVQSVPKILENQVSGMHIAHGLMHRCSQYFGLGGPNHKSHAITSSEIFEKREFLWAKNERSEAGGLVCT